MSTLHPESGRVEHAPADSQAAGNVGGSFANDSLAFSHAPDAPKPKNRRTHVTARRTREVAALLSPTGHLLLSTVARLNVASGNQLRRLAYPDTATGSRLARKELSRLTELRVLARLDRRVGGVRAGSDGYVYALDLIGQRLTRPGRRRYRPPWTPRPEQVAHALAVTDLYVALKALDAPRTTLRTFHAEPAAWRSYAGPGGSRVRLKPDAFAVLDLGDYEYRSFVEMDRATESSTRIAEKARAYIRYWQSGREQAESGMFPCVVWVVPTERRAEQIAGVLAGLPPEHWHLFAVATADRAAVLLTTPTDEPTEEVTP